MKKFITYLSVITIVFIGLGFLINKFLELGTYSWVAPVFYFVLTILSFYLVFKGKDGKQGTFFARLAGGMFLRMFLCVIFILAYIKMVDPYSIAFIAYFMFLYFVFTSIEVYYLMKVMKKS